MAYTRGAPRITPPRPHATVTEPAPSRAPDARAAHVAAAKFAALACVLGTGAALAWRSDLAVGGDVAGLEATLQAAGPWGPALYVVLFAAAVVFALPATPITLVGAALFEPALAYAIILAGAMLGALVSFGLGRWLGRDFVALLVGTRQRGGFAERLEALDEALGEHGFATMTYLRLTHLPYSIPSYLGALSRISWRDYTLGTLAGSVPNAFVFVFLGDTLRRAWETGTWEGLMSWRALAALGLIAASALAPLVWRRMGLSGGAA